MRPQCAPVVLDGYQVALIADPKQPTIAGRTVVRFRAHQPGGDVVLDLAAQCLDRVMVDGRPVDPAGVWDGARLRVPATAGVTTLDVRARFPASGPERGYRFLRDPTDDLTYLRGLAYPRSAPAMFCCFDDPASRAPVSVTLTLPAGWTPLANTPVIARSTVCGGVRWRFAPSAPIVPHLVALAAGPWSALHHGAVAARAGSVPVALHAHASRVGIAPAGRAVADLVARSLLGYEELLDTPYPYRKLDVVFMRDLPPLAFSAPGIIMISDGVLDRCHVEEDSRYAALVISHEVAHAWFGGLVGCARGSWLDEALATYASRLLLETMRPGQPPATGSPDSAYLPHVRMISAVEAMIGRDATVRGLRLLLRRFAGASATASDLGRCWSQASGRDLTAWAAGGPPA